MHTCGDALHPHFVSGGLRRTASHILVSTMSIKDDATTLLIRLAQLQRTHPNLRTEYIGGPELNKLLPIGPERLSDAVALLEESGYVDVLKTFGTAPYDFSDVMVTSRGRFEAERLAEQLWNPRTRQRKYQHQSTDPQRATIVRIPPLCDSHSRWVRLSALPSPIGRRQPRSRGCEPADRGVWSSVGFQVLRFRTIAFGDRRAISARSHSGAATDQT